MLLDYLVKYVRIFRYRKNYSTYGQFLTIFFVKNPKLEFKITRIYQYSIFLKFETYFIKFFHY